VRNWTQPISVSIQSESNDDARFSHGIAHQFGLVDLYAHPNVTFPRAYVDEWDNMATPFRGQQPLVWSKERAQWLTSHGDTITFIPRPAAGFTQQDIVVNAQESTAANRKAIAIGLTPGRLVAGADPNRPVVRVVYLERGRMILLDQQRLRTGQGPGAASGNLRWTQGDVMLYLHGEPGPDVLRNLQRRVR
jgi:hypothetical protein